MKARRRRHRSRGARATRCSRARSSSRSTNSSRTLTRPDRRPTRRSEPQGSRHRGRARADAALRRDARHVRADQRRHVFRDNGTRLVRRAAGAGARAGLEDERRAASNFSRMIHNPLSPRRRSSGSSSGRSSSPRSTVFSRSSLGLFLAIALTRRACASSASTGRCSSSRRRCRASSRCSSGRGC